tara:strand:- start:10422 stop:10847 length:426 start_codon:yes stop_codon:yes gene_type:complete
MKSILHTTLILSVTFILSGCFKDNDGEGECNPNAVCYTQPPETLYVTLHLSDSPDGSPVKVRLYVGDVDDGQLFDSFTTTLSEETYLLPVNTDYSAEAEYSDGEITIIAVDGDRLNRKSFENCDVTCYDYDHGITLDLELE